MPVVFDTCWEGLFLVVRPAFQSQSFKVVCAVGYALRRIPVNSVVPRSMMFSNVIVDITFPLRSLVFSQSCCEISASLFDVRGVAIDLINCSLSIPRFILVFNFVSNWRSVEMGLWATRISKGCRMREMFSDMPESL